MTRAVLCGAFLLSIACSSSPSSPGPQAASGASGGPSGVAGAVAQGGASTSVAGAGGSAISAGAAGSGAVAGAGAENGGAPALAGAGGTVAAGAAGTGTAGTAGTVGSAGAAGAVATAGAGGGPAAGNGSVTQRGADSARTSHWVQPTLTKANMAKMAPDTNFKANFAGEFTSSPLFLAGATPGTGRFYAATTENDVYALDETSGATVWKRNIGGYLANAPVCLSTPIHHGILSTGVIDPDTRVLYVAAAMADGHHEVHALSLDNMGAEVAGWPLDVSTVSAGTLAFKPIQGVQNQRSALSLVGGIIYVAFGGYCGDAGAYHGWVVAVDSKDPKKVGAWATSDARQAGIWAAGGLASDGNGVFAITGNVAGLTGANHAGSDSEEILRLTGLAVPHRDNANLFLPAEWANPMNASDKDFGSCSPALITVPNSTPSKVIVAPAKPGHVYFLDATNLGGERGQFAEAVVATTTDQSLYTAPSAYQAPTGVYVAMTTGIGSQCPNGGGGNGNVMSILMQPGVTPDKPPMPKIAWCAPVNSTDNATHYISPISTNSAGSADPIVWMINAGKLNAFDGEKGTVLYDSGASTCVGVQKFTAPIAVNGRIVTGGSSSGQAHLCSWSVH